MFLNRSASTLTDTKSYIHLVFLGILVLFLIPLYYITPTSFFTLSNLLICCLAFYLMLSGIYSRYITKYLYIPTISLFYGSICLIELIFNSIKTILGCPLPPVFYSIKAYYVARISFAIILVLVSYFYVHKRHLLHKLTTKLFIFIALFSISSFYLFKEDFIIFIRQHSLGALYFSLFNHLLIPISLGIAFFEIYKLKEEIPNTHKRLMLLFIAFTSIMECIDILYFTPLTVPIVVPTIFKIINLSILVIAQLDICVLRPFQELCLKQAEAEQLITNNSQSLTHYSERVEHLQAVLHSQSTEYQKIISIIPEPFIVCIDSIIYQLNPAAMKLLHSNNPHDFIGTNILSYIKDAPTLHRDFPSLVGTEGMVLQGEGTLLLPNTCSYNIEYLFTSNTFYTSDTVICMLRDISSTYESENAKQELYKQQLKFHYFSGVSHDIKTPINIIYSALQMQSKSATLAECTHYTDMMHTSCLKLLKLLNNLLDLTKIDNQMLSVSPQYFNLVDAVESLCEVSSSYMNTKNIDYIFDTDSDEKYVFLDPNLVERIILNLLSNAVKYTNVGGHISVYVSDHHSYVKIHIKDTGIGIPEDKLASIFEHYTMLGKNLGANEHSCGMGLSIVKDLLHLMDGSIYCKSKLGVGSEFIVTLPTPPCDAIPCELPYTTTYSTQNIKVEFCDI